jgi:hypothetical protein
VKRTAKEGNITANWLAAGKTADGLINYCLEDRSGEVFLGCTVVDERLNIGFGKYTAYTFKLSHIRLNLE